VAELTDRLMNPFGVLCVDAAKQVGERAEPVVSLRHTPFVPLRQRAMRRSR